MGEITKGGGLGTCGSSSCGAVLTTKLTLKVNIFSFSHQFLGCALMCSRPPLFMVNALAFQTVRCGRTLLFVKGLLLACLKLSVRTVGDRGRDVFDGGCCLTFLVEQAD